MDTEKMMQELWEGIRSRPDDLRDEGLMVAVHNDYMDMGTFHTFWLMTYKISNPEFRSGVNVLAFKGEGRTDQEALDQIRAAWAEYSDKLHHAPACPANHYHGKRAPTGRCNCGALDGA